eukprot:SAG11_NODE_625_length_8104_cov_12.962898_9_plen_45_part_00
MQVLLFVLLLIGTVQYLGTGWAEIVENFWTGEFFSGTYCRFYDF